MDPHVQAERNEWKEHAEERFTHLQTEIHELETRLGGNDAPDNQRALEDLKIKRDAARLKLNALHDKDLQAWNTLQVGLDAAWEDLEEAVEKAKKVIVNS